MTVLLVGAMITGGQAAEETSHPAMGPMETATPAKDAKPMPPLEMPRRVGADQHHRIQGMVNLSKPHHGDIHRFLVTGATHGTVWGSGVYTSDSHLGVAAVHAGVLKAGETGVVTVRIVNPPSHFVADKRHGVTTHPWGPWEGAFVFLMDGPMSKEKAPFMTQGD